MGVFDRVDVRRFLGEKRFTVLFSGGKDSLAALLWVLDNVEHDDWNILYVEVTGNTHPLCNQYVHQVCRQLGIQDKLKHVKREDLDFFEALRKWGTPIIGKYRWCLYQFKLKLVEKHAYGVQVLGIRKEDSSRRRNIGFINVSRLTKTVCVQPVFDWTRNQVVKYIREHGLDINPCYRIYGHSGNCMFCPYHDKKSIILTLRDPLWRSKILSSLGYARGRISRETMKKWVKLSKQTVLKVSK